MGYPIISNIVSLLDVESRTLTITFRLFVIILSIFLLVYAIRRSAIRYTNILLPFFFLVYIARLSYDWLVAENPNAYSALEYFIAIVFIPCIAIWYSFRRPFDDFKLAKSLIVAGFIFIGLYHLNNYLGLSFNLTSVDDNQRMALGTIGPIALGHASVTVILVSIFLLVKRVKFHHKIALLILILASSMVLLEVSSRGPMVALFVAGLWFLASKSDRFIYFGPLVIVAASFISLENFAIQRVFALVDFSSELDFSALQRLEIQALAIQDFLNNIFVGKHFLDPALDSGKYPHNIVIESGMALGLVGLIPLLVLIVLGFYYTIKRVNKLNPLLSLLFVQYFINSQLSGNLWGGDKFFLLVGLVLIVYKSSKNARVYN